LFSAKKINTNLISLQRLFNTFKNLQLQIPFYTALKSRKSNVPKWQTYQRSGVQNVASRGIDQPVAMGGQESP